MGLGNEASSMGGMRLRRCAQPPRWWALLYHAALHEKWGNTPSAVAWDGCRVKACGEMVRCNFQWLDQVRLGVVGGLEKNEHRMMTVSEGKREKMMKNASRSACA